MQFCVVTARRATSYVTDALSALAIDPRVMLVDVDNSTGGLPIKGYHPHVLSTTERTIEPCDHTPEPVEGDPLPTCAMRQLSLDVAAAGRVCMRAAEDVGARWVVLHEDDMMACGSTVLDVMERVLKGLDPSSTRIARFARLGRVVAVPVYRHLPTMLASVVQHAGEKPLDSVVLAGHWAPANTVEYVYPHGLLFTHRGRISTLPDRNTDAFHASYDPGLRSDECEQKI